MDNLLETQEVKTIDTGIETKKEYSPFRVGVEQKDYSYLLEKLEMTEKDKEGMQKSVDFLVVHEMDTEENIGKLDAIVYTQEYIEIGGVKWAREDVSMKSNNKDIFQYNNVTYFKRSNEMIGNQNTLLATQGMGIPSALAYRESLQALPGTYSETSWYEGGNILSFILNISSDGYLDNDGELNFGGKNGFRLAIGYLENFCFPYEYGFNEHNRGGLQRSPRSVDAMPIRPIFK